jgi:hypothetical protein
MRKEIRQLAEASQKLAGYYFKLINQPLPEITNFGVVYAVKAGRQFIPVSCTIYWVRTY